MCSWGVCMCRFSSTLGNESDRLLSTKAFGRGSSAQGSAEGGLFSAQITRKGNWLDALQHGSLFA